jgi:hypothetical protein
VVAMLRVIVLPKTDGQARRTKCLMKFNGAEVSPGSMERLQSKESRFDSLINSTIRISSNSMT